MLVFVYGTLKKGNSLNRALVNDTYIGPSVTSEKKFDLIGGSGYPYMIKDEKAAYHIRGDLYDVSEKTLERLDMIEGVPHHYVRETILVKRSEDVDEEAFVYLAADGKNRANIVGIKFDPETATKEWHQQ